MNKEIEVEVEVEILIDNEELLDMIIDGQWENFYNTYTQNIEEFESNSILKETLRLFESEFLLQIEFLDNHAQYNALKCPGNLMEINRKLFSEDFIHKLIDKKFKNLASRLKMETDSPKSKVIEKQLFSYMSFNQGHPAQKKIFNDLMLNNPVVIANATQENISITSNQVSIGTPMTISMFKSPQEENFHKAIREVFPTFNPVANVAFSTFISFDSIKFRLSNKEQEYFKKAVLDCVVYDNLDNYKPKYFFELDSKYHDIDYVKFLDKMKNLFFEISNIELMRIRPDHPNQTSKEFFMDSIAILMRHER